MCIRDRSPRHVGRRRLDDRALANQLVVQAVDARREDHHPRAGIALAALAHEQHGVAAADRAEVRRIAVLPVDLEAERIAIVVLARMEAADVQDRPRTGQIGMAGARLRGLDERVVALAGALAPRQPEHETASRQDHEPHGTNVPHAARAVEPAYCETMEQGSRLFRLFVSSTFRDMLAERTVLQARVFPRLEQYCRERGARFQAVDLRWGVSEAAGHERQTMSICIEEVRRCREMSPSVSFIALLGERYGWRPLPTTVD